MPHAMLARLLMPTIGAGSVGGYGVHAASGVRAQMPDANPAESTQLFISVITLLIFPVETNVTEMVFMVKYK